MCPPCGEGWSQPCRSYIGWAGLLWNRMEKLPQRMGGWTDRNIEPHISVSNVLSWTLQAHSRASWEYHLHANHPPANITRYPPQINFMLTVPSMNALFLVTTPHIKLIPTYPLMYNTFQEGATLTIVKFIEQRPPGTTLQALNVSCQLSLTTILGIIFNHDPHLTDKVTESGRLVQGHTAQQSYKSRQDTLAPPSMLIIDQL